MRGLFIVFGQTFSGAEKVLCDYLCQQKDFDYVVYLVNHNAFALKSFRDRLGNTKVFDSNTNIALPFFIRNISRIFWKEEAKKVSMKIQDFATNGGFDFLYANSTLETSLINRSLIKGIPAIFHVHDMISTLKSPIRKRVLVQNLSDARTVFVPSQACREELIRYGVSETTVVTLYNHIDFDENQDRFQRDFTDKIVIGFVGALSRRKALDTLLKAARLVSTQYNIGRRSLIIKVAYHIEEKAFVRKLSKLIEELKLLDRIEFVQNLSKSEIDHFYESCDLIVVPSRRDPLPTVVLEAVSKGKIVIGSRIDGIPEMIADTRLLFEVDDSRQLAKRIYEVISASSKERNNMFNTLYTNLKRNFSFEGKRRLLMERLTEAMKDGLK